MPVKANRVKIKKPKNKSDPNTWRGSILDLKSLGYGVSGLVSAIDDLRVVKSGFGSDQSIEDIERERRAYSILSQVDKPSPHILRCFEFNNPRGLILERCSETIRHRLKSMPKDTFVSDLETRTWTKQAAEALAFIHSHNIIHADFGCHNLLIDFSNNLKLCDFGGASVQGASAVTNYEAWSRLSSKEPTTSSDIFALGSSVYEMTTKEYPYREKSAEETQRLFQKGQFPSVRKIKSLGTVIVKCWSQIYANASEIVFEIDPKMTLCCGAQGGSIVNIALPPRTPLGSSFTSSPLTNATTPTTPTSKTLDSSTALITLHNERRAPSNSSLKSSNKSLSNGSFKKEPIKGIVIAPNHDEEHSSNEKKVHLNYEKTDNRENNTKTKVQPRQRTFLSQWMSRSLAFRGSATA